MDACTNIHAYRVWTQTTCAMSKFLHQLCHSIQLLIASLTTTQHTTCTKQAGRLLTQFAAQSSCKGLTVTQSTLPAMCRLHCLKKLCLHRSDRACSNVPKQQEWCMPDSLCCWTTYTVPNHERPQAQSPTQIMMPTHTEHLVRVWQLVPQIWTRKPKVQMQSTCTHWIEIRNTGSAKHVDMCQNPMLLCMFTWFSEMIQIWQVKWLSKTILATEAMTSTVLPVSDNMQCC